jgi:hypothetical protein
MKGALRSLGKSFRLGNSPKLQKRFISRKTLGARKGAAGFKKFMGASNKTKGRFIRSKVNTNQNVKFAKKFFKSSNRTKRRWIRKKANLIKRKAAEKALEGGKAVLKAVKSSVMKKGFNPLKFVLMVFAGWLVNQLPKIIEGIKKFIDWAKPAFEMLGKVVKGIVDFMKWIGGGLSKLWTALTGGDSEVENAKSQLEAKNQELKGTFDKQEKGFKDLEKKAKKEEGGLKKEMDDLDKDVKTESDANKGDATTSVTSEGKVVASTTATGEEPKPPLKTKVTPKTTKVRKRRSGRNGKLPVTVIIKGKSVVLQPGTPEYEKFVGGTSSKIIHGKVSDVNLVKDSSGKPKIVTVDMPLPPKTPESQNPSTVIVNEGSSDGVNRKVMLTAIDS